MPEVVEETQDGSVQVATILDGNPTICMMEAELLPSTCNINTVTFCTVKIAGKKVRAIVDTSTTQCVLAWQVAHASGLLRSVEPS